MMTIDELMKDISATVEVRIAKAIAAERERCAAICEARAKQQNKVFGCGPYAAGQLELAVAAIRNKL